MNRADRVRRMAEAISMASNRESIDNLKHHRIAGTRILCGEWYSHYFHAGRG